MGPDRAPSLDELPKGGGAPRAAGEGDVAQALSPGTLRGGREEGGPAAESEEAREGPPSARRVLEHA